jgi:hypothetical protein
VGHLHTSYLNPKDGVKPVWFLGSHASVTFPLAPDSAEVRAARCDLGAAELEAFDQLLSDGWKGTLPELLEVVAEV